MSEGALAVMQAYELLLQRPAAAEDLRHWWGVDPAQAVRRIAGSGEALRRVLGQRCFADIVTARTDAPTPETTSQLATRLDHFRRRCAENLVVPLALHLGGSGSTLLLPFAAQCGPLLDLRVWQPLFEAVGDDTQSDQLSATCEDTCFDLHQLYTRVTAGLGPRSVPSPILDASLSPLLRALLAGSQSGAGAMLHALPNEQACAALAQAALEHTQSTGCAWMRIVELQMAVAT